VASARLSDPDRARYERSLARIGAPGAPELLPPELAHPAKAAWEDLARKAKTPQERFTALFFLNRFKAPDALAALEGLRAEDAKAWPKHLHLEAQVATARINGGEVSPALQTFLDGLKKAGKGDPIRAQAAQLRLVMAEKEKALLPPVEATPASELMLMDAWNSSPWEKRQSRHLSMLSNPYFQGSCIWKSGDRDQALGMQTRESEPPTKGGEGFLSRLLGGLPASSPEDLRPVITFGLARSYDLPGGKGMNPKFLRIAAAEALGKMPKTMGPSLPLDLEKDSDPSFLSALLPSLRALAPERADKLRSRLLTGPSSVARAAAIDDLPSAPADLDALAKRCFDDSDMESALELFSALDRWKLGPEQQKAVLTPFLQHPDWGWRYQAWVQLRKTDPAAPWPSAPAERPMDKALLAEATKLAERGKPVRLRITFSGHRVVTLKLDPAVAPMNVANLVLLAKRRFFDGHRVPRVVPDFVVQMGSPLDTMDGGPGYSVRCEDSLDWYGPGSVGMALAGKDTGGCQFFITTNATPHLTGKYTRLGEVENLDHDLKILDGLELGAKIESVRVVE
jgi:cyclophilin family peptidyl-prolyl cis-trans isomerase